MNNEEYIASGVLELYVSGGLSAEENSEVENRALSDPRIANEIEEIKESLANYAASFQKNPRPELRMKIMERIDSIEKMNGSATPILKLKTITSSTGNMSKYLVAASLGLLVLSIAFNVTMWTKYKSNSDKLTELETNNSQITQEIKVVNEKLNKSSADLKVAMSADFKIIQLSGMKLAPTATASVWWNPKTKESFVALNNLPAPPTDKQYQLWAITKGKGGALSPVDAGVFDMNKNDGMHAMKNIDKADMWAVTLEKKGGSPIPSMNQMYLISKS